MSASRWTSSVFRGRKQKTKPGPRARGGLARGLLLVLLPLILGPLITFAVLIYRQVQSDTSNQAFAQLESLADLKKNQISTEKLSCGGAFFQLHKTADQNTTFTTQNTTTSPPKNHHQNTVSSKTPLKTPAKTAKPRLSPGLHFFS